MTTKAKITMTPEVKIKQDLLESKDLKPFPIDTVIETLEFFDQYGIMLSKSPMGVFETTRDKHQPTDFLAVYINGELGLFIDNKTDEILLNRLENFPAIVAERGLL